MFVYSESSLAAYFARQAYILQMFLSADWLNQFSDPYAVLGISVTADDRRVLKRYRSVAKLLHPDRFINNQPNERQQATLMFGRLVNPAYQKVKQEKNRAETLATLRFRVRQMNWDEPFEPKGAIARQLLRTAISEVDIVYEQAVTSLAEAQYQPLEQFEAYTKQLEELNLVYLRLKMGELIREKATGLVPAPRKDVMKYHAPKSTTSAQEPVNYADRHYHRAQEYMKKANWAMAVQELRDAIRLEATRGEYHSLLAKAYLMQNLPGMAKVHFRQALKFNPQDPLALAHVKRLNIQVDAPEPEKSSEPGKGNGFFGLFAKKK